MEKFSSDEIIELAIQIERNGFLFYDQALKRKDLTENSRKILEHLRQEEINHKNTFKAMRVSDTEQLGDLVNWQEAAAYLKSIAATHIFNKKNASIKLAIEAENEQDIIRNAIQFEKDTLLFFYSLCRNTDDEGSKKIIDRIIDEEVGHVTELCKMLESLR